MLPLHFLCQIRHDPNQGTASIFVPVPDSGSVSFYRIDRVHTDTIGNGNPAPLVAQLTLAPLEDLVPVPG